jgi:uncharacterized protein YdiU (UPF0061 family)
VGARELFMSPLAFDAWAERWRARLASEGAGLPEQQAAMRRANPAFMPRNHLVKEAISAAEGRGDFGPCKTLLTVLATPFDHQCGFERFAEPPRPDQVVHETYCGT